MVISTGVELRAALCPDWDGDFYHFPVTAGMEIRAQLYDLPGDFRLALFDPSGTRAAGDGDATTRDRDVSGRLYHCVGTCSDWIAPLAAADIRPTDDPLHDATVLGDLRYTLNFLLPEAWTASGIQDFCIEVNPDEAVDECSGCRRDNNWYFTRAHGDSPFFFTAEPLHVVMYAVTADGVSPSASREETYRWLLKTYPLSALAVYTDTLTVTGYDFTDTSGTGCGTGWGSLLDDLEDLVDEFGIYHFGMLGSSVPHDYSGCGRRPGQVAAGITSPGSDSGGRTMAHEVGHNLGRMHADCGGPARPDPDYPHPGGEIGVYGVDLGDPARPAYMDPDSTYDIMSYCSPRWMSDYTYEALQYFPIPASQAWQQSARGRQQEYLVGSGSIVDGLVIMPRPFYRLVSPPGADDAPGQGRYALELQDVGGTSLFTRRFDTVGDSIDPVAGNGSFRQVVPWYTATARIVFKDGQTVLHITHVSANPPQVTLTAPNGGEAWPAYGTRTVTWVGSDADGDPLRYRLQYSADDGATWRTVATDLTGASYALDLGRLAGSAMARLRVIVSDGVNTAQDASDAPFSVEGKPPEVSILYPLDGATLWPGRPMLLEAAGTDLEDGPLADDTRFTWRSSLEGDLGIGRRLYFDDLLPGWHTLTVTVSDDEGFVGRDSVTVVVGRQVYLPSLLAVR